MKKLVKPSLNLASINIDYILLSHGYIDHMSYSTLFKINKSAIVISPKNLNFSLKILGFKNIILLSNAEIYSDKHLKIKVLKANHDGSIKIIDIGQTVKL